MVRKQLFSSVVIDAVRVIAEMGETATRGRSRRSPVYLWFRSNHDLLLAEFAQNAPSWTALATILGDRGLTNGDGEKPTPEGCRTVWTRVRREVAATRAKRAGSGPEVTEGVRPIASELAVTGRLPGLVRPVTIETDGSDYEPPVFKLASLRNATPADPPPVPHPRQTPSRPQAPPQADVDDVLAEFLGKPQQAGFHPKTNPGDE